MGRMDGRDGTGRDGPTEGSTRGPPGPKKEKSGIVFDQEVRAQSLSNSVVDNLAESVS